MCVCVCDPRAEAMLIFSAVPSLADDHQRESNSDIIKHMKYGAYLHVQKDVVQLFCLAFT